MLTASVFLVYSLLIIYFSSATVSAFLKSKYQVETRRKTIDAISQLQLSKIEMIEFIGFKESRLQRFSKKDLANLIISELQ